MATTRRGRRWEASGRGPEREAGSEDAGERGVSQRSGWESVSITQAERNCFIPKYLIRDGRISRGGTEKRGPAVRHLADREKAARVMTALTA
ncbi:hypothetical protein HPB48_017993 [Haemaphysalis longicornis]|uniref:Uncharacterized protein n=1 Tax=Haemaphysalis longicornis TaxID=44386 RepID=A0A9J6FH49_HAELO|nr:hypothetical protein HPB48_017993 [Haemaphysalis longicornis]